MLLEEIIRLIKLSTTRVIENNVTVKDPNGSVSKYSLYDANGNLLLSASWWCHGNVFILKTEQSV